jgi:hypothetical protein
MSTVREEIQRQQRLARMRQGQLAPELEDIPSMDGVRVGLVPLTESEAQQGMLAAATFEVDENFAGMQARNRVALVHDVWNACREPSQPDKKVWESPAAMQSELDPGDIDYLAMRLSVLMDYAAPSFEQITEKELEALKKACQTLPWRELSGTQAAAARVFLSTVLPEALPASLYGRTSTDSSTQTSERDESTFDASRSTATD